MTEVQLPDGGTAVRVMFEEWGHTVFGFGSHRQFSGLRFEDVHVVI